MKNAGVCLFAILLIVLLAGCGPADSLNPLFHDKEVVFDPDLLGTWTAEDGEARFDRPEGSNNSYLITSFDTAGKCDPSHDQVFEGHLVNLDGHRFLDLVAKTTSVSAVSSQFQVVRNKAGDRLEPNLFYLDNDLFVDFVPAHPDKHGATYQLRFRPAHHFFTIKSDGQTLQLGMLDEEWMEKAIQKGNVKIDHAVAGETHKLVLTATTEELQRFVREHETDTAAFSQMNELHRK